MSLRDDGPVDGGDSRWFQDLVLLVLFIAVLSVARCFEFCVFVWVLAFSWKWSWLVAGLICRGRCGYMPRTEVLGE